MMSETPTSTTTPASIEHNTNTTSPTIGAIVTSPNNVSSTSKSPLLPSDDSDVLNKSDEVIQEAKEAFREDAEKQLSQISATVPTQEKVIETLENVKDKIAQVATKENAELAKQTVIDTLENVKEKIAQVATKENVDAAKEQIVHTLENVREKVREMATRENVESAKQAVTVTLGNVRETIGQVATKENLLSALDIMKEKFTTTFNKENLEKASETVSGAVDQAVENLMDTLEGGREEDPIKKQESYLRLEEVEEEESKTPQTEAKNYSLVDENDDDDEDALALKNDQQQTIQRYDNI